MKNLALSLLAIALIAGAPLAAQEQDPTANPLVQEERTNPDADSITGDSGLTITGTVVSFTDSALVLQSTAGQHTIQLTPQTSRPSTFTTGERLAVDYTRNSTGVMIATAVRQEGTAGTEVDHSVHMGTTALQNEAEVEAEVDTDADLDTEMDTDVDASVDTLPETGSDAPLAGLIGLVALAAATALRSRKA
jgi:LPXTG-motif cell wall-anchored protein